MKYFYSLVFLLAGVFLVSYAIYFARQGGIPIKSTTYYRHRNAPAFWFFTSFFCFLGLASLVFAFVIPFLKF